MFKSKKLVALGLAAVALFSTVGVSLAYWASAVTGNNDSATGVVTVGSGDAVTTTVSVADVLDNGKKLVPAAYADTASEVSSISLVFTVDFNANQTAGDGAVGSLTVTKAVSIMNGTTDYTASLSKYVTAPVPGAARIIAGGDTVNVTIPVSLIEPVKALASPATEEQAILDSVHLQDAVITFTFTFTVAIV